MPCICCRHYLIYWTVSWQTSSGGGTGGRSWSGPHVCLSPPSDITFRDTLRGLFRSYQPVLPLELQSRLDRSAMAKQQIVHASVLNVDYYPRESHLITLRDPWSFPTLFHPACNHLVRQHMEDLAQKVPQLKSRWRFESDCIKG